jgi:hypothetical protein
MPTGYTDEACKKDVPFNKFVWDCARAFGALIMMRDDSLSTPVPESFEPSDYHPRELAKAKLELAQAENMTLAEAKKAAMASYKTAKARLNEVTEETALVRTRLLKLRAEADAWVPPSEDHAGLKKFMLEQLDETIKYDGTVSSFYSEAAKKPASAKEWQSSAIASAKHSVEYHAKELEKEVERIAQRNKWISDLVASVPYPGKMGKPRAS